MLTKYVAAGLLAIGLTGSPVAFGQAKTAAAPATQPAKPETPSAEAKVVDAKTAEAKDAADKLTGGELAIRAQQAFNRGEYAVALPLLKKMAAESEGLPAKLSSIQERIRVSEKALASAKAEADAKAAKPKPAVAAADNTAEARKPHKAPAAGQVLELAIPDLGNFDYDQEKGGNVPSDVLKLAGSSVRLKGYMIPMDQAENITQFALVPSLFACCFGQPPSIQHTVVVSCPKGKAVGYTPDEIQVEGTLKVQEKKDDGYIISLFEMDVASVKLSPKG